MLCRRDSTKVVKVIKMNKKKLKIVLEVLLDVSIAYLETAQYIENNMMDICSREFYLVRAFYFVALLCCFGLLMMVASDFGITA